MGSFEATARSSTLIPEVMENVVAEALVKKPEFRHAFVDFEKALRSPGIQGAKGETPRNLVVSDLGELLLPHLTKARFEQAQALMTGLSKGEQAARTSLAELELEGPYTIDLGTGLPAAATFCHELVDMPLLEKRVKASPKLRYYDARRYYEGLSLKCAQFGVGSTGLNIASSLTQVRTPTLIFAGKWDPVIPWQATQKAARTIPGAKFMLIDGGHSPVLEGGVPLAEEFEEVFGLKVSKTL